MGREIRLRLPLRVRLINGGYYWQPTPAVKKLGFYAQALGREPIPAFARAEELNKQVQAERTGQGGSSVHPRSVAALIKLYRSDPHFKSLAPKTQTDYGNILNRIEAIEGSSHVPDLTRADMKTIYRAIVEMNGLAMANAIMRVWSIILGMALDENWISSNPAAKLRLTKTPPRRRRWTDEERAIFCAKAVELNRRSLALAVVLGWDIAQREGDILELSWADWDGKTIPVTAEDSVQVDQNKTEARVRVPLSSEGRRWVEATPRTSTRIVVSEATHRPYSTYHFIHEFARIRAAAGLPTDLQFRDLRRTALTEAGEGGATDDELRSMSGHKTREVLGIYVVPTDEQARSAQRKRQRRRNKKAAQV